jgi:hypothetical protein
MAPSLVDVIRRGEVHVDVAVHPVTFRDVLLVDAFRRGEVAHAGVNVEVVVFLEVRVLLELVKRRVATIASIGL